jgi:hypothetical protein
MRLESGQLDLLHGAFGRKPDQGDLDHAVQRDMIDDFELSYLNLRVLG